MIVPSVSGVILLVIVLLCNVTSSQYFRTPQIPCPNIFEYGYDGNSVYGIITLTNIGNGQTTVQVEMTQPGALNSDYSGKLSLAIDKDRVFDYIRSGTPIKYRVDFPLRNVIPRITDITVNNVRLCSGPKDRPPRATVNLEHTLRTYAGLSANQNQPQIQRQPEIYGNFINNDDEIEYNSNYPIRLSPNTYFSPYNLADPYRTPTTTEAPIVLSNFNPQNPFFQSVFTGQNRRVSPPRVPPTPPPTVPRRVPPANPPRNPPAIPQVAEVAATPIRTDVIRPVETAVNPVRRGSNVWNHINAVCGQENTDVDVNRLAVNGEVIAKARFPWIVAIYTRNVSSLAFQCGGSLISTRTVVSAAHCFYGDVNVIPANRILMSLGRHNLNDWQNAINVDVEKIINHPDFRSELTNFDADVSIVHLKRSVSFSVAVRPICLYDGPTDFNDGAKGIIVGWGEDETHTGVTAVPKLVNVTIVSELTCIRSNENFLHLTSNRTLCAGNRDGSGPCMGDSGSGLMLRLKRKWMLRGTVSASLASNSQRCDLDEFVVYSDIAKFQDWIKSNMIL